MRPSATVSDRGIHGLMLGCAFLLLACSGESAKPNPGGTGGALGSGGANPDQPDAASASGTGGATSGGTTTSAPGTGGTSGGRGGTSTGPSTGGATAMGGRSTQPGNGGRSASATGGATTAGGGQATGGAANGGSTRPGGTSGGGTGGAAGSTGASAPVPSEGCGQTPPASGTFTIDVGGTSREYILKLPDGYDPSHPYRLIFGFHGAKYDDKWVAEGGENLTGPYFGIESEAQGGAIFVAPQANPTWGDGDLAFVDAMVARFESQLCIDKSRIFSVGFSMGAIMTLRLGCNRSEVFRGIAPMSGSLPSPCPTGRAIAYWAAHGTSDTTISPSQGQAARDEFARRSHCGTQTSSPDANNCVTYSGCDPGYPVVWCTFSGAHVPAPFAGKGIWSFLAPL